jgi:hypothetical protein
MDLTHRFKDVAALENVLYPNLEINGIYPVVKVQALYSKFWPHIIVVYNFDTKRIKTSILMNAFYSYAFTWTDIVDINRKPKKYCLIYRKKNCAENNYYFQIKKL